MCLHISHQVIEETAWQKNLELRVYVTDSSSAMNFFRHSCRKHIYTIILHIVADPSGIVYVNIVISSSPRVSRNRWRWQFLLEAFDSHWSQINIDKMNIKHQIIGVIKQHRHRKIRVQGHQRSVWNYRINK